MSKQHALLSPSSASRWLACTPSAKWESEFPNKTNEAADEGTFAHELSELYLRNHFKLIGPVVYKNELRKLKSNSFYNAELNDHCTEYVSHVINLYESYCDEGVDAMIAFEEEIDLSYLIPEGFGHIDINMYNEEVLHIVDLKYGKGVKVDAHENKQMMVYALGCLKKVELTHSIETVRMTIYQPRLDNIVTYEISAKELREIGKKQFKPKAELAFKGKGEYVPGKHCKFCKAAHRCKTLADHNLELADHEFAEAFKLDDKDISEILKKIPMLIEWAGAIKSYALEEAMKGKKWEGFKLVNGKSNRKYLDEKKIIAALKKAKFKDDLYLTAPSLVGITTLEKNVGKEFVAQKLKGLIVKPEGAPTLVEDWDQRPELNSPEKAKEIFKDVS